MNPWRRYSIAVLVLVIASVAHAQERITPADQNGDDAILSTHKSDKPVDKPTAPPTPPAVSDAPAAPDKPAAAPAPIAAAPPPAPPTPFDGTVKQPAPGKVLLPAKVPFGHASMPSPESAVPSAPHTTVAIPVGVVDAVEATEPAPPTPVAPGADPVKEDPTEPTELTSPIFDESDDLRLPRKIELRVLNKVTAQSTLFKVKPGDVVKFGKLEVTAINCRVSAPSSQPDAAGLLDIREHTPGTDTVKSLFHGWMYASSPSIAALEHPIYDVMMVSCEVATPVSKDDAKPAKKADNSKKK